MTRHEEISFRASVPKLASVRVYRWRVSYSLVPLALSLLSKENNVASLCNLCKMYTPLVEKRKEREISRRKVEKDTLDPIFRVEKFESRIDERMQKEERKLSSQGEQRICPKVINLCLCLEFQRDRNYPGGGIDALRDSSTTNIARLSLSLSLYKLISVEGRVYPSLSSHIFLQLEFPSNVALFTIFIGTTSILPFANTFSTLLLLNVVAA